MLKDVTLEVRNGQFHFPKELKGPFLERGGLTFWDGSEVSAEEIWQFLNEEAPQLFPYFFTSDLNANERLPHHIELLSSLKLYYLRVSRRHRVEAMRKAGWVLALVNGGPPLDVYFGARAIPLRPGPMADLIMNYAAEKKKLQDHAAILEGIYDDGASRTAADVCRLMRTHSGIRRRLVPVDILAPYTAMRCSDMSYLVEWQRADRPDLPKTLIDYPWDHAPAKSHNVKFVVQNLRDAVKQIDQITGRQTTDEDLKRAIRWMNRLRMIGRKILELWWSAPQAPTCSKLVFDWGHNAHDALCDPVAMAQVFEETYEELKERVEHGINSTEVSEHAARFWVCGSCVAPSSFAVDARGGALLARDDRWSSMLMDVDEEGDPYENITRSLQSSPYEQIAEKRALWVVEESRKARASGLLFAYHWGCNYQGAISRVMCDVAKEAGVPAMNLEQDDLGRATSPEQSINRISAFIEMLGGVPPQA